MAERLARLFGTEEDKVNCSFFFKIGACRHMEKCTRLHYRPPISTTIIIPNMYDLTPIDIAIAEGQQIPDEARKEANKHFEEFYEEVFLEMAEHGEITELIVCENLGEHLIGNVYVKFEEEDDAEKCLQKLTNRYYAGKVIKPEFSPVSDFREARCRQFDETTCARGGYCNFIHRKMISSSFKKKLFKQMYKEHPDYKDRKKQSKSRSRHKSRKHKKDKKRKESSSESKSRRKERSSRHKDKKKRDKKRGESSNDNFKQQNSEERRQMIAQWNQDEENQENKQDLNEQKNNIPEQQNQTAQIQQQQTQIEDSQNFQNQQIQEAQYQNQINTENQVNVQEQTNSDPVQNQQIPPNQPTQ